MYGEVLPVLLCPTNISHNNGKGQTTNGGVNNWGVSTYGASYYAFGNPDAAGVSASFRVQGRNEMPTSFPDGLSNTIFFTEIYGTCGSTGDLSSAWGSLWADANSVWRPVVCTNAVNKSPSSSGYPPCLKFQVQPDVSNTCDTARAQSPHAQGMHVAIGDGGVRFVSENISDTVWANVCDPRDGSVVGEW